MQTLQEKSQTDQSAYSLPRTDPAFALFNPVEKLLRTSALELPEVSELDLMRHFSELARRNVGIDTHFYPLGSCTMKFNPRVNEWAAQLPSFSHSHPLAPEESVQGNLQLIVELIEMLNELCGMQGGTLTPNAGAQGEFVGIQMIAAYHTSRGDHSRNEILIPDTAHGTNPASAAMAGFRTSAIATNAQGDIDIEHLKSLLSPKTAGLMLTNPSTLGLFSPAIQEISQLVHRAGAQLYYDGANLNAILNIARPGEMGFDVMHLNLHKTFSTPHGGGGPGSGPVLCKQHLKEFLPTPRVFKEGNRYRVHWNSEHSIGPVASFFGNFGIYLRAYLYFKLHGQFGLRKIAEQAVLNANYLKLKIEGLLKVPYPQPCMHEFVVQADQFLDQGIRAFDIAKRLLDYGVHAPTIYFPQLVKECLLIEPTESESLDTLDRFIAIIKTIIAEIKSDPHLVSTSPHHLSVKRIDETRAARTPILKNCKDCINKID